jgi:hypothetical protein
MKRFFNWKILTMNKQIFEKVIKTQSKKKLKTGKWLE